MSERKEIPMTGCISSNVDSYGFDQSTGTMRVKFNNGSEYDYNGVTQETFDEFSKSESKGRFISENIKGKFDYTKLEPLEDEEQ